MHRAMSFFVYYVFSSVPTYVACLGRGEQGWVVMEVCAQSGVSIGVSERVPWNPLLMAENCLQTVCLSWCIWLLWGVSQALFFFLFLFSFHFTSFIFPAEPHVWLKHLLWKNLNHLGIVERRSGSPSVACIWSSLYFAASSDIFFISSEHSEGVRMEQGHKAGKQESCLVPLSQVFKVLFSSKCSDLQEHYIICVHIVVTWQNSIQWGRLSLHCFHG